MKILICNPLDDKHYLESSICFIREYTVDGKTIKAVRDYCLDLIDCDKKSLPEIDSTEQVFVYNKRLFDRFFECQSYDLATQYWLKTGTDLEVKSNIEILSQFKRFFAREDYGKFIPYVKHIELCDALFNEVFKVDRILEISQETEFYRTTVYAGIQEIEKSGLYVELEGFNKHFKKEYNSPVVHCHYNLHTTTGRPSNNFDNINYNALSKKDSTRSYFISRFSEGRLIEFDFDAYHIRLIGDIVKHNFPEENLHTYFGKQYFRKEELSEEEYKESKMLTFKFLYSTVAPEYASIEFFRKVEEFKLNLWNLCTSQGYIESPVSKKKIFKTTDLSKSKLFNYLLQAVETEVSMIFIKEVIRLLKGKESKLVLYTYDSFLIDFCPNDGKTLLQNLIELIKHARVKVGKNYKDLHPFLNG